MSPLLDAYLRRIGMSKPERATVETLRSLHAAHLAAIPFENLDILLGRGVHLDVERLRAKLVDQRRGGYCFEQNSLFLAILRELGFFVAPMEARVRVGADCVRPRTHMVLAVEIGGDTWLADVGFGGDGLLEPEKIPPQEGCNIDPSIAASRGMHRVILDGPLRVLQMQSRGGWIDLYAFLPQEVHAIDLEVANWYTSTHPRSVFVRTLTAQRTTRDVRYILRYPTYSEVRGFDVRNREITRAELIPLLRDVFLIDVAPDTTFAAIDAALPGLEAALG